MNKKTVKVLSRGSLDNTIDKQYNNKYRQMDHIAPAVRKQSDNKLRQNNSIT